MKGRATNSNDLIVPITCPEYSI